MERFQSTCYSYYFDAQLDLICSARASSMPPTGTKRDVVTMTRQKSVTYFLLCYIEVVHDRT